MGCTSSSTSSPAAASPPLTKHAGERKEITAYSQPRSVSAAVRVSGKHSVNVNGTTFLYIVPAAPTMATDMQPRSSTYSAYTASSTSSNINDSDGPNGNSIFGLQLSSIQQSLSSQVASQTQALMSSQLAESLRSQAADLANQGKAAALDSFRNIYSSMREKAQLTTSQAKDQLEEWKRCNTDKYKEVSDRVTSLFEPTKELIAAFPDDRHAEGGADMEKGSKERKFRYMKLTSEDGAEMGYRFGFCINGEMLVIETTGLLDPEGSGLPVVRLIFHHRLIPEDYSVLILPVGRQDIPVPFLSLPLVGLACFGAVLDTTVLLLNDGQDGLTGSLTLDGVKRIKIILGLKACLSDSIVGFLDYSVPEPPIHLGDYVFTVSEEARSKMTSAIVASGYQA